MSQQENETPNRTLPTAAQSKPIDEFTEPMSHEVAMKMNAVEKYLLDDISPEEREQFEAHYFECDECAKAVISGQQAIANLPAYVPEPPPFAWLRSPVYAALAAGLLAVVGFQNMGALPILREQFASLAAEPDTVILARQTQLGPTEEGYAPRTPSLTVGLDTYSKDSPNYPFYRLNVRREPSHTQILSRVLQAPEGGGSMLYLHIPRRALGSGSFAISVFGMKDQADPGVKLPEDHTFSVK